MNFDTLSKLSTYSLALIAIVVCTILWVWQRKHVDFDLADLITGDNGRVSFHKFAAATALLVSTWGFVAQVQNEKLTEAYFGLYMAVWAGANTYKSVKGSTPNEDKSPVV